MNDLGLAPPPGVGKQPNEFLFRRTLPKSEPSEKPARRHTDKQNPSTAKRQAERTASPQRRDRGGGRGREPEVAAFPGFAGFTPQFLTQFIAQALMPGDGDAAAPESAMRTYQDTEARANPDIVFGPVGPITAIA